MPPPVPNEATSFTVVRVCGGLNLSPRVRFSWGGGEVWRFLSSSHETSLRLVVIVVSPASMQLSYLGKISIPYNDTFYPLSPDHPP